MPLDKHEGLVKRPWGIAMPESRLVLGWRRVEMLKLSWPE